MNKIKNTSIEDLHKLARITKGEFTPYFNQGILDSRTGEEIIGEILLHSFHRIRITRIGDWDLETDYLNADAEGMNLYNYEIDRCLSDLLNETVQIYEEFMNAVYTVNGEINIEKPVIGHFLHVKFKIS